MKTCDICGRDITNETQSHAHKMTLCCKHYAQIIKYGHTLDSSPYSVQDANEFRTDSDITYIILKRKNGQIVGEAIIDTEDLDRVIIKKWRLWNNRVFTGNMKPILLAYVVLDIPKGGEQTIKVIDHINGNPLDNRKCNLRIVTQ